ncbi:hypothetical protein WDU94_010778 [Cyamophila willieti]
MIQVALRYLSSQQTLRQIGDTFNLADSTIHSIRDKVCRALARFQSKLIKWPTEVDAAVISAKFKAIAGFPNVIGAIDGSHIPSKVREDIADDYLNRKMFHSIVLQGICTSEKLFTNVSVGCPGRMHDSRVLQWSQIYSKVESEGPTSLFYEDYHLLGDSAYGTKSWLLSPYKATRPLTRKQRNYNYVHSKTRVPIENTFGLLKNRWRRLQYVNVYDVITTVHIVIACCVLHNFCLLEEDFYDTIYGNEIEEDSMNEIIGRTDDQQRLAKREAITEELAQMSC